VTPTCCNVEINVILCIQHSVMSEAKAMQVLHLFKVIKRLENKIMKASLTITSTSKYKNNVMYLLLQCMSDISFH